MEKLYSCKTSRESNEFTITIGIIFYISAVLDCCNRSNRVIVMLYTCWQYVGSRACGFATYVMFSCAIYFSLQPGFSSFYCEYVLPVQAVLNYFFFNVRLSLNLNHPNLNLAISCIRCFFLQMFIDSLYERLRIKMLQDFP